MLDRSECFSHGQFYVAASRVRNVQDIRIACHPQVRHRVTNIVQRFIIDQEEIKEGDSIKPVTDFDQSKLLI